ncbi:uncharacterized protein LOC113865403 isoform X2 [Abrus precatorius]|uniref:ETFB lysine methyltransferase n=1 Tax=Abrus precatorius TaxID=3816 RepID=A0A8B8LI03_ABRPR|nr:uncharacterized protein LOC113865403 isoform X2 [Abrus precatorius]
MAALHFLKQLTCLVGAHSPTLSRRLIHYSPLLPFLSNHHKIVRYHYQWLHHLHPNVDVAASPNANFSTAFSSPALSDNSLNLPQPYSSVLIYCPKDTAICISSIFPEGEDINASISHAADSIGLREIPRYEVKINEEEDWIKRAHELFQPVQVTEGLWVVPKWCTPPAVQATNIILNPGVAFGTGEHASTKLCLLLLHDCIKGGEHVLDYGTGTGILAIAALKVGAAFAVGVDVDAQAIASASQNASLNNIGPDKMQLLLIASKTSSSSKDDWTFGVMGGENTCEMQRVTERDKFDVVIANILLNPLLNLADEIISWVKPGAVIGLSGILSEQVQCIIQRYSPFLEGIEVSRMDDWACVSGRKRNLDVC